MNTFKFIIANSGVEILLGVSVITFGIKLAQLI